MAAYFFAQPVDIDIKLENEEARKMVDVKLDKDRVQSCPVYFDGESVVGSVTVRVRDGRKLVHDGIKVEYVGCIELFYDRGNHHEFLSLSQELAAPGEMRQAQTFEFSFKNVEKQFESYQGINVKLRYFVRVTLSRRMADVVKERDTWVHSYRMPPDSNNSIKMEVGIEDCLHIEFEYNKSKYHLKDVIVGKIYFLLVRIKIKHMELSIIRRETTGAAPNQYNESETITKFEIMDGAPVRGETIPIRLFLGGFELTPTFRDVNKKFSTRYYLNLVLIDEENRRYFKQQEITVFRIPESPLTSLLSADYQPKGSFETINGLKTYITGEKSSKKAIVVTQDIFGMRALTQQGCDILASKGFYVVMPDFLGDDALQLGDVPFDTPEKVEKRNRLFAGKGNPQGRFPEYLKFGEDLKAEGFKVGGLGYCWGAKITFLAGASDVYTAVAAAHPSLLEPKDAENMKAVVAVYPSSMEDPVMMEPFKKIAKDYKLYSETFHGFAAARAKLDEPVHKAAYEDVYKRLVSYFQEYLA
ncbi:vacuolar protein sorting-associated protein 26 [Ceratobasidium sp. AG-Ba]|nr:vacuolar protein sorting-associated protein 26 [Ceratobasidium sp. AG-Ba]